MATIEFQGTEAVMRQFQQLARSSEDVCKKAVKAGAEVVVEKLKAAAPVRTGGLRESIKAGAVKYSAAKGYYSEIEPTGKDEHGEPYAKIGNILEYGRSYGRTKMAPKAWFHPTVAAAEGEAVRAMAEAAEKAGATGK